MSDAMVVARMPQEKKEAVAKRLAELGTNASRVINQLYDYIERTGTLPFDGAPAEGGTREQAAAEARSWMGLLVRLPEGNRFQHATDEEIREARLRDRFSA